LEHVMIKIKAVWMFLLSGVLSSMVIAETVCVGGLKTIYDAGGVAQSPRYEQDYISIPAAVVISERTGKAVIKTPDIVCTRKSRSSSNSSVATITSSSISSSNSSSRSLSASSQSSSGSLGAGVVYRNNFDDGKIPSGENLYFRADPGSGATLTVVDGALRGTYPLTTKDGGPYIWGSINIAKYNAQSVCSEFDVKMPGSKQGLKFYKVFSQNDGMHGYANSTFGAEEGNGEISKISFADGSSTESDVGNSLFYDGNYKSWAGRSWQNAVWTANRPTFKDWGTGWHRMKFCVKFNSGTSASNEVADGAYLAEIDA
jgi:hypothetical protein